MTRRVVLGLELHSTKSGALLVADDVGNTVLARGSATLRAVGRSRQQERAFNYSAAAWQFVF